MKLSKSMRDAGYALDESGRLVRQDAPGKPLFVRLVDDGWSFWAPDGTFAILMTETDPETGEILLFDDGPVARDAYEGSVEDVHPGLLVPGAFDRAYAFEHVEG